MHDLCREKEARNLKVINFVDYSLNQGAPAGHESTETPIGHESLDISGNLLSVELPNCWMYWRELTRLKLGNNNLTGHIPRSMGSLIWLGSLHLRNNHLSEKFPLPLKNCSSLVVLDLGENEFTGTIPAWMRNFDGKFIETLPGDGEIRYTPGLMVLVLHSNKFKGSIPLELCHLDSLQILDLGNNNLSATIPRCFGNFSSMIKQSNSSSPFPFHNARHFDSESTDTATLVMKGVEYEYDNTLGLLVGIDLSSNKFSGEISEELTDWALTSLESLDLSMNRLSGVIPQLCGAPLTDGCGEDGKPKGPVPDDDDEEDNDCLNSSMERKSIGDVVVLWLQAMNTLHSLSVLILSDCGLDSINPLPVVNFSSLTVLHLSDNQFVSPTFDWFSSLGSLASLDLSSNNFHGPIPTTLCNLTALRSLHLFNNSFTSTIPGCLSHLTSLENLSNNALEGEIPRSLGEHCNLQRLDLSSNKLVKGLEFLDLGADEVSGHFSKCLSVLSDGNSSSSGPTSVSVRGLSSLSYLDMSGNSLKSIVSGKHFANLTRLKYLHASSNSFTLQVGSDWNPPFQLEILKMGYWQLGPLFPAWLQTQKDQMDLDISRVSIKDDILSWFWSLNLDYINLADTGSMALFQAYQLHIRSVFVQTNSLAHCPNNEENILWSLDLSGNILSGELPDCWASWTLLMVLRSQNNILTGHLPSSMGSLLQLRSLHLHNNSLSGTLPPSMQGCKSLSFVDLSENEFSGSIPLWVGKNLSYGSCPTIK
ncbi:LRR receptor-like serine/threonine-protein kinase FLS2 [Vitis vinifera]|uniref:LRR receptor-like serine/threonine-protein kinase FLS2 n=1 Tax=Vitis vinifera TaxID=29760 RepID=A0A438GE38_VITVI|nr:LRR receptor-like serine/threonine-protein kinase FLS2 [Vitis vinifera]